MGRKWVWETDMVYKCCKCTLLYTEHIKMYNNSIWFRFCKYSSYVRIVSATGIHEGSTRSQTWICSLSSGSVDHRKQSFLHPAFSIFAIIMLWRKTSNFYFSINSLIIVVNVYRFPTTLNDWQVLVISWNLQRHFSQVEE